VPIQRGRAAVPGPRERLANRCPSEGTGARITRRPRTDERLPLDRATTRTSTDEGRTLVTLWHPRRTIGVTVLASLLGSIAMITITDKGAEKVREFFAGQSADVSAAGLRVGVKGGGCSGFQYQLAFDEQRDTDAVFEDHGLKLLADRQSLPYVAGSVIDYEESLQGAGFRVNNPNVVAACGCGSSFRVAEEEQVSAV
jgi:iron-sulfur cluster assembly protein